MLLMDFGEPLSHGFDQGRPIIVCENRPIVSPSLNLCIHSLKDVFNVVAKAFLECIGALGEVKGDCFSWPPQPLE
jgi:hypothetical protein